MPICSFTPRANAAPSLVALLPQEEKLDGSNIQILPPGFHVVCLPYAGKCFMYFSLSCILNVYNVRFEVLCVWSSSSHCFEESQCFRCQDQVGQKHEALWSFKTTYPTPEHNILKDLHLQVYVYSISVCVTF